MARQYIDPAIAQMAETEDGTEERIMAIVARAKKEGTLTPFSRHYDHPAPKEIERKQETPKMKNKPKADPTERTRFPEFMKRVVAYVEKGDCECGKDIYDSVVKHHPDIKRPTLAGMNKWAANNGVNLPKISQAERTRRINAARKDSADTCDALRRELADAKKALDIKSRELQNAEAMIRTIGTDEARLRADVAQLQSDKKQLSDLALQRLARIEELEVSDGPSFERNERRIRELISEVQACRERELDMAKKLKREKFRTEQEIVIRLKIEVAT